MNRVRRCTLKTLSTKFAHNALRAWSHESAVLLKSKECFVLGWYEKTLTDFLFIIFAD